MSPFSRLPRNAQLAAVHGPFAISQGRVTSPQLVLQVGSVPITLDGWTGFDGRFDYRIRAEALAESVVPELRAVLVDLPATVDEALDLRLQGGDGPVRITAGGLPLGANGASRGLNNRELLRDVARRFRDRMVR